MKQFNPPGFQARPPQAEIKQPWEVAIEKLAGATSDRLDKVESNMDQLVVANKNIETQIAQLANTISARDKGKFPSMSEVNPKEYCNAITLKSGKQLGKDDELVRMNTKDTRMDKVEEEMKK